jgi:glycosyltransferase involved in cell wall biosynthesis
VISGEGDQRERWITLARGLDNVVFTGWLESREIHYMMSIADIGLVAIDTIPQALPNKVFEYFSAGLPVLSSLGGEAARLIQDERCGINYKAGDPESFMQALSILLDDPVARAGYGRNAARVFTDGYRAEKVYTDMVEYLVAIASAHGKTVPHPRDSLGGTSIR